MSERRSDRWLSILLSVLVHAAIVGALVWGWWQFRTPAPAPQTLAIEATVVRGQPPAAPSAPAPSPAPSPPPQQVPPQPSADALAEQKARAQEAEHKLEEQQAAEKLAAEQREADQLAQQQREREEAQRAQQEQAEAALKAKEEAAAKAKAEAASKAQELAQRKSEQERAARESELQSQLAAEEHLNVVRASGEQAQYAALIRARIERAWIRPPSARAGIDCVVQVTQVPGGAVTAVQVGSCNGDQALRESIEAAVYRASPLPAPSDPALFERDLIVNFRPSD